MTSISETPGTIVESWVAGRPVRFFVENPKDEIQKHHATGKFYEMEQLEAMSKFIDRRRVFLDVGANVGNHTLYMDLILGVTKVVPFEVNPTALRIFDINLALNHCASVETAYLGFGAAATDGPLVVSFREDNNLGGTRFARVNSGELFALRLDGVTAHLPVGFIKVDVEGMELEVLTGLRETVSRWRPPMFVELEEQQISEFNNWNRSFGYRIEATFVRYRGKKELLILPPNSNRS
jgi:FkbM family methyltransferase